MTTHSLLTRGSSLKRKKSRQATGNEDLYESLCLAIDNSGFIPIVGDTIRISHIFDVDSDDNIGPNDATNQEESDTGEDKSGCNIQLDKLNIIEELACSWARSEFVNYPLTDGFRISRVAQYYSLTKGGRMMAKLDFLEFLKTELLQIAYGIALNEKDAEEIALIEQLFEEVESISFSDIVAELDFPRFRNDQEDPLTILARLPVSVYVTTSFHNFLERELEAVGRQPRSLFCFWNDDDQDSAPPEYRFVPTDDNTTVERPVVYHLLGIEQYPKSMVLSEDDYLDILWALGRNAPGDSNSGMGIIPPFLERKLKNHSLLLLGYRIQDWDLKILFRGLLKSRQTAGQPDWLSTAIQFNVKDQPLVQDKEMAKKYLNEYFKQAKLEVSFGDSDEFINELWEVWKSKPRVLKSYE